MAKSRLWRFAGLGGVSAAAGLGLAALGAAAHAQPGYGPYGPPPSPPPYGYGPPGAYAPAAPPAYGDDQGYAYDAEYDAPEMVAYAPPPPLPIYDQPPIPGYGYIWTPGYWAWNPDVGDYYWVPGTWVLPPRIGLLWTPGFWQWRGADFVFIGGYWGPTVGFYGGVNYGFGYDGEGYEGGRWRGDRFYYNRRANNISNVRIETVYDQTVIQHNTYVSYNGGTGGIPARPTPEQLAARRGPRLSPTAEQVQNVHAAMTRPDFRASVNQGRPVIAATPRPGVFRGAGVVTDARVVAPYVARPIGRPQGPGAFTSPPQVFGRPGTPAQGFQPRGGDQGRLPPVPPAPQVSRPQVQQPQAPIQRFEAPRGMNPAYGQRGGPTNPAANPGYASPRPPPPAQAPRFAPPPRAAAAPPPPPVRAPQARPAPRPAPPARDPRAGDKPPNASGGPPARPF